MRYRNCLGEFIRVDVSMGKVHAFVAHPINVYLPLKRQRQYDSLRKRVGVSDLRRYLIDALRHGSCIIVQKDDYTLFIQCNKLEYMVDFETLEILNITER